MICKQEFTQIVLFKEEKRAKDFLKKQKTELKGSVFYVRIYFFISGRLAAAMD